MQEQCLKIRKAVIIGGGPVGNFCAVMSALLGIKAIVYEKRQSYTRQINIKIEPKFFKKVSHLISDLTFVKDQFFQSLEELLNNQKSKIQLKKLEALLRQKAQSLGVQYYVGRQIKSFQEAEKLHEKQDPIILDCTGRNSLLRINQFGPDKESMVINKLADAMHINFDAVITSSNTYEILYPILKNHSELKLGQIVISKPKGKNDKLVHITIPLFISDKLGQIFDAQFPNINRNPVKPFSSQKFQIPAPIQQIIHSLFCVLIMEDWVIKWESVQIKKIQITCGYSNERSRGRYVCMGDSAAHFAYFKSLNFGLQQALGFFKVLASYPHLIFKRRGKLSEKDLLHQCYKNNPHLWPVQMKQGTRMSECMTKTRILATNTYSYNLISKSMKIISLIPFMKNQSAEKSFQDYEQKICAIKWEAYLQQFETNRFSKIKKQISSNLQKSYKVQIAAYIIWANSLSPFKISQGYSYVKKGYSLNNKDYQYYSRVIKKLKQALGRDKQFIKLLKEQLILIENMYSDNFLGLSENLGMIIKKLQRLTKGQNIDWNLLGQILMKFDSTKNFEDNNYKTCLLFLKAISTVQQIRAPKAGSMQMILFDQPMQKKSSIAVQSLKTNNLLIKQQIENEL